MTIKPTHLLSLRLPIKELEKYLKLVEEKKFSSVSEAIRECGSRGILLLDYKDTLDDPQKSKEFFEKLDAQMNEKKIFDWLSNLSSTQFEGLAGAIEIVKSKR